MRVGGWGRAVLVVLGLALVSGCGPVAVSASTGSLAPPAPSATGATPTTGGSTSSTPGAASAPSASAPSAPAVLSPPTLAGATWVPAPATDAVRVARLGATTLMWMDARSLRFRYVPGTMYPEGSPATAQDRSPGSWVPTMVAAFNSGYKLSDHVGGFAYLGRTVQRLRPGLAAFTVTRDGVLAVGVWGRDLTMTPGTVVVRENLPPLVEGGVVRASASDGPRTWGIANGNAPRVNRSALARLGDGSLVFAFGHGVTAWDLARTLTSVGAVDAVMLDMNRSWPTGFVYRHVGGATVGRRIDPRIGRDPSTYLHPFKKDFVVVSVR